MENTNQFLGTERAGKLMRRYAVPCIISLLVGALYNIVDQIFIANASYLGSYGNAANTVVFPLTVVALAAVALVIGAVVLIAAAWLLKLSAQRTAGALSGFIGQPAILAYANARVNDERIDSAYGALFALGTIVKILLVQLIALA